MKSGMHASPIFFKPNSNSRTSTQHSYSQTNGTHNNVVYVCVVHSTCGLSADESHERQADGGDRDRENYAQVVFSVTQVFKNFAAGPCGPLPVSGKRGIRSQSKQKHQAVPACCVTAFSRCQGWEEASSVNWSKISSGDAVENWKLAIQREWTREEC